jgi:hypothetical protein
MRSQGNLLSSASRVARIIAGLWLAAATAGCAGDDTQVTAPPTDSGAPDSTSGDAGADAPSPPQDGSPAISGVAKAMFSSSPIDFGGVGCGAPPVTQVFSITGSGPVPLAVTAATSGDVFAVSPGALSIGDGGSGTFVVTATIPSSATAGTALTGSLNLFTNDPANSSVAIPLSATPTGGTLDFSGGSPSAISFPTAAVGVPAPSITFSLENMGNAPAAFAIGAPNNTEFSLTTAAQTVAPGQALVLTASFTPTNTTPQSATAAVTATGATCGNSVSSISLSGQGTLAQVTGWPTAPIDFGPATCGGAAPAGTSFTLTNVGTVVAEITEVALTGAPGFTTSAQLGQQIAPNGGVLVISVAAPAVPSPSPLTPVTATLSLQTSADTAPTLVTLTEEPQGAVLSFDTSPTPGFGSFGSVVLLESATQNFNLKNAGNSPADVTLSLSSAGDGGSSAFTISDAEFSVSASASQQDSVTFSPVAANVSNASVAVATTSPLCATLPAPVPLSGVGLGGGPSVFPTSLSFSATCGGAAPGYQAFAVRNEGTANLNWTYTAPAGPGASQYAIASLAPPGLLTPGQSASLLVQAAAIPSPAPNPDPAALAATVTITTDVPLDPPHVVSLSEVPLCDQLSFSLTSLRFGQPPINTTLSQPFAVVNEANPGSAAANVSFVVQGSGASAYAVTPLSASDIAPGGGLSSSESVAFTPVSSVAYPASLALATSDSLCAPLPTPISMTGTGAQGKVAVSPTILTFGTSPSDPAGLVNCGATGPASSLTISNVGNADFAVTALTLGLGAASPYQLSGAAASLPADVGIGDSISLTITPKAIPSAVANPNDASPFSDTLTITTNAALDTPHSIALVMQARGAVIANTPLSTTWNFGTIGYGSIGTVTSTIRNAGNAPASLQLSGLAQPSIFGIENNPTTAAPNAVTAIVGQFIPASSNGAWTDQGTLAVTADALCASLPSPWSSPMIALSGASNAGSAVAVSGSLVFPTTDCGSAAPGAQSITLSNGTNVAYAYTAGFNSGAYYTLSSASPGTIPANGTASVVVAPKTVTPGPGVQPGSAPYADELVVTVATSPPTSFVVPISWALNGAVLSLPQGAGPEADAHGDPFYPADTASGFAFPMHNTGTATATVDFGVQPLGFVQFSPAAPLQVIPGIPSTPVLSSAATGSSCPATTTGSLTFVYAGPVCQPFPFSSVAVEACVGSE